MNKLEQLNLRILRREKELSNKPHMDEWHRGERATLEWVLDLIKEIEEEDEMC